MSNSSLDEAGVSRRGLLHGGSALLAISTSPLLFPASAMAEQTTPANGTRMSSGTITVKDGTQIFYKDWGSGQPIVFHHGWPLSADDWDAHMMFFMSKGYRVIAHDRRGHGRSTQTDHGNDYDTFVNDVAALVGHLDLKNAIHIGHSMGGAEVIRYVAQHGGGGRVSKAVTIGAVPPLMLKTARNPGGRSIEVFDSVRSGMLANRSQFFRDVPAGPFFGFNQAQVSEGIVQSWWRQGMMGAITAQYDCIKAFSETDFTEDLRKVSVPVLVMHGEDDQVVPIADSALLAVKLLKAGTLKTYPGLSHGMHTTHHDVIDADILAFIKG